MPIVYQADNSIPDKFKDVLSANGNYVAICAVSSNKIKDMPYDTTLELIKMLNNDAYKVIFIGCGDRAKEYAAYL